MARSVKFEYRPNAFQRRLADDVKGIQSSSTLYIPYIPADKTTNIYKMKVKDYQKLLQENITAKYIKKDASNLRNIHQEAKEITKELKLDDRIERFPDKEVFITLQDHKKNFQSKPKCRVINPAKSEMGKIRKHHLNDVNKQIRRSSELLHCRSTAEVLKWFSGIRDKHHCKFIKFDIVDFYPSITEVIETL